MPDALLCRRLHPVLEHGHKEDDDVSDDGRLVRESLAERLREKRLFRGKMILAGIIFFTREGRAG